MTKENLAWEGGIFAFKGEIPKGARGTQRSDGGYCMEWFYSLGSRPVCLTVG